MTKKPFLLLALLSASLLSTAALAQHTDKETKDDIARHRAIAAAHEGAAKCLEAGKGEKVCMAELVTACKGLALGKFCGMRHAH